MLITDGSFHFKASTGHLNAVHRAEVCLPPPTQQERFIKAGIPCVAYAEWHFTVIIQLTHTAR